LRAVGGASVMGDISNIRQLVSAARSRILLICPDCGQEHVEFADRLRGSRFYSCTGDNCDYRFDLVAGPRTTYLQRIVAAWRRFYTAFMPAG
jgi:transposase-like protein